MKHIVPFAALAAAVVMLPGWALAASSSSSLLARVPALPQGATAAYGQWVDVRGDLSQGPAFETLENDIRAALMAPLARQEAVANSFAARYGTPAGQAELAHMSTAQKMALAQQMQAQMAQPTAMATVVSGDDGALLRRLQPNPEMLKNRMKLADSATRMAQIDQQWDAASAPLAQAEQAEISKLAICRSGESAEPSQLAVKDIMLKYADRHAGLAPGYLAKYQALASEKRAIVAAETHYADDAMAAWSQLRNPALKSQMQPLVTGTVTNAANDVNSVLLIVEAGSKKAAQTIARRKQLEAQFADAKGC